MTKRPVRPGGRVCRDCGVDLPEHEGRGRPPVRCPSCRPRRRHRVAPAPSGPRLTVVPDPVEDDEEPWDSPQPWQVARDEPAPPFAPEPEPDVFAEEDERISAIVARDLDRIFSAHPAAATLGALARRLAQVLDEPVDGRVAAAVTKELRATVADLVRAEEGDDDDLFGEGGPAPVVVTEAG